MTQTLLFLACYGAGLAIALAAGLWRRPWLAACVAFPLGLGVVVVELLAVLVIGLPYGRGTIVASIILPTMIAGLTLIVRPRSHRVRPLAIASLIFLATATIAGQLNQTWFSYDSHQLLFQARSIGLWEAPSWDGFGFWGSFMVVAHSMMVPLNVHYLFGIAPVMAISTLATLIALLVIILGNRRPIGRGIVLSIAFLAITLALTWTFALHSVYIHTNLPSALYLLSFVGLYWIAEEEDSPGTAIIAIFFLFCFSLMRLEAPIVACLFLALTVTTAERPIRHRPFLLMCFGVLFCGWLVTLGLHLPTSSKFLTRHQALLLSAGGAAAVAASLVIHRFRFLRLQAKIPGLLAILCILAAAGAYAIKPEHMGASATAIRQNLLFEWHWAGVWWLLPASFLLSRLCPQTRRVPASLRYGPWLFLAVVFLLGFARDPYRLGKGDSASRMMVHVLPLLFLYIGARFLPAPEAPTQASGDRQRLPEAAI